MAETGVVVVESPDALAARGADEFVHACARAVADRGRFAVALSGGKTPRAMLSLLADRALDWSIVHFFWGDERCVPADDAASNYGMTRDALLSKIAVPEANVHRMRGELPPEDGADAYDESLRTFFAGGTATFDLVFLGLGPDGHTASLFPGTPALRAVDRLCVANEVTEPVASPWRLTLTYPVLNAARRVAFLVEGADKATILRTVVDDKKDVQRYPAQGIAPTDGELVWLVDAAAASQLRTARTN